MIYIFVNDTMKWHYQLPAEVEVGLLPLPISFYSAESNVSLWNELWPFIKAPLYGQETDKVRSSSDKYETIADIFMLTSIDLFNSTQCSKRDRYLQISLNLQMKNPFNV